MIFIILNYNKAVKIYSQGICVALRIHAFYAVFLGQYNSVGRVRWAWTMQMELWTIADDHHRDPSSRRYNMRSGIPRNENFWAGRRNDGVSWPLFWNIFIGPFILLFIKIILYRYYIIFSEIEKERFNNLLAFLDRT